MLRSKLIILFAFVVLVAVPMANALAQEEDPPVPVLISAGSEGTGAAVISDDQSLSDAITYTMTEVAPPSEGKEYVGWLVSDDGTVKLNTGAMTVAEDGSISHVYTGANLIDVYSKVIITEEEAGAVLDAPAGSTYYSHEIPLAAMANIRHLLTDWPEGSGVGILTNLQNQLSVALTYSRLAEGSSTLAGIRQNLELVVNAIEGPGGANYGDLDGNGTVEDLGDGIGALSHAADRSQATLAVAAAPDDTVITTGADLVEITGKNAEDWAISARTEALRALKQTDADIAKLVAASVTSLLNSSLIGVDADGDGTIGSVVGEGGAQQAYVEAQGMATYTLAAGIVPAQPTPTPTPTPEAPATGDTATPLLAQIALIAAVVLLGAGGLLMFSSRRSRS